MALAEPPFDELNSSFKRRVVAWRQQHMNVIGH